MWSFSMSQEYYIRFQTHISSTKEGIERYYKIPTYLIKVHGILSIETDMLVPAFIDCPVMVISVPPDMAPWVGDKLVMLGVCKYQQNTF